MDFIRASSPAVLREQTEHMDAPDRWLSLHESSCTAGGVHTCRSVNYGLTKNDGCVRNRSHSPSLTTISLKSSLTDRTMPARSPDRPARQHLRYPTTGGRTRSTSEQVVAVGILSLPIKVEADAIGLCGSKTVKMPTKTLLLANRGERRQTSFPLRS